MKEPERGRAMVLARLAILASLCFSAAAQGEGDGESWHVPLVPQTGLLNSGDPGQRKYVKEVIWIDEPTPGAAEAPDLASSAISVDALRLSLGEALGNALAKNELAGGIQVRAMGDRSATPAPGLSFQSADAGGEITLSRDVIPLLLQSYSKAGRRVTAMSGPPGHGHGAREPSLRMQNLLQQERMEQSRDQISYASASSTASFHDSRPSFAFDGDPATVWMSQPWNNTNAQQQQQWLEYSFEVPQVVSEYSLSAFPALGAGQVPTNENSLARLGGAVFGGATSWALKCSENGVIWMEVHRVGKSQPWVPGETRSFPIHNLSAWNYCRVYIYQVPQRPDGQMQAALSEVTFATAAAGAISEGEAALPLPLPLPLPQSGREATAAGRYTATDEGGRLRTPAGRGREACAFPFTHNGILQHRCIPFQERFWCKTAESNWLVCGGTSAGSVGNVGNVGSAEGAGAGAGTGAGFQSPRLGVPMQEATSQAVGQAPSSGVPEFARYEMQPAVQARQCDFPFLYYGSLHDECIPFDGRSWCKDRRDRWLACGRAADESSGATPPTDQSEAAATPPTHTDWYLPLGDLAGGAGSHSLNVLEMRPHRNSNAGTIAYNVCKVSGHADYSLYIPPQYTALPTRDDDAAHVQLPQNFSFPFYGEEYSDMFVGSNGYITFETADMNYLPSAQSHLGRKRIAVMFTDVDPTAIGGEVQFADLGSAVAVTWRNVTLHNPRDHRRVPHQTFQTILFRDGTIWMGFESAVRPEAGGLIGLSSGSGGGTDAPKGEPRVEVTRDVAAIQEC